MPLPTCPRCARSWTSAGSGATWSSSSFQAGRTSVAAAVLGPAARWAGCRWPGQRPVHRGGGAPDRLGRRRCGRARRSAAPPPVSAEPCSNTARHSRPLVRSARPEGQAERVAGRVEHDPPPVAAGLVLRTGGAELSLAAVLGGTQSLHTNSFDEALALPSDAAARIARNTQLVIAEESGRHPRRRPARRVVLRRGAHRRPGAARLGAHRGGRVARRHDQGRRVGHAEAADRGGGGTAPGGGRPRRRDHRRGQQVPTRRRVRRRHPRGRQHGRARVADRSPRAGARDPRRRRVHQPRSSASPRAHAATATCSRSRSTRPARRDASARSRRRSRRCSRATGPRFVRSRACTAARTRVTRATSKVRAEVEAFAKSAGRRPRMLVVKMGQDGHDRGAKVIATAFADLGFDVDVGPLFQTPEEAARDAIENDVHVVGVSSQAAGHKTLVPELIAAAAQAGWRRHRRRVRWRDPRGRLRVPRATPASPRSSAPAPTSRRQQPRSSRCSSTSWCPSSRTEVAAGDRRALARAITLVESTRARPPRGSRRAADGADAEQTGGAARVGISGAPGSGKSTLIEALGVQLVDSGHQRRGARGRPVEHAQRADRSSATRRAWKSSSRRPEAFVRPSPTGGTLGGVTRRTREAMLCCEAAGFDVVLVETVGVGQSEVAVEGMVDTFVAAARARAAATSCRASSAGSWSSPTSSS